MGDLLLNAARPFLGLAARDFLSDVAKRMVGTEFDQLRAEDIDSLCYWVRIRALQTKTLSEERTDSLVAALREAIE